MAPAIGQDPFVAKAWPFGRKKVYRYTAADRRDQLHRLSRACARIGDLFEQHLPAEAAGYQAIAVSAARLSVESFDEEELRDLSRSLPPTPSSLHPRCIDSRGSSEPWEDEVATWREEADRAALELRAFATYDRP